MTARRKLLIDTDPGIDDAFALLFAFGAAELEVVACTSIFGNATTELATANLHRLLRFAPDPIPVGVGAAVPLVDPALPYASVVHGSDGLGDVGEGGLGPAGRAVPDGSPARSGVASPYAAQLIIASVLAHPGELTVVTLGPLTNLALALALEPRIESLVAEVVIMGGAYAMNGNLMAAGEANVVHDVHAAERVLAASWPTTLITIDVTTQVVMGSAYLDALATLGERGRFLRSVSRFYERFHRGSYGLDGIFAHDPTALMWTVAPELFRTEEAPATVITSGAAYGQTLIDRRGRRPEPGHWSSRPPVRYCTAVDGDGLLELFRSSLV